MQNLGLENFWNPLKEKYPLAVAHFCKWIDEYKERVGWNRIFNGGWITQRGTMTKAPKFHDIPVEMQIGILLKFGIEHGLVTGESSTQTQEVFLAETMKGMQEVFLELNQKLNKDAGTP